MTSTSKNKEMKDKRADSIEAVQEANEQPSLPSIYSIAAAHSLSKDLKQKVPALNKSHKKTWRLWTIRSNARLATGRFDG